MSSSSKCETLPVVYGECPEDSFPVSHYEDNGDETLGFLDVWQAALVIREAARCIVLEGPCPDAFKCDKDQWKLGTCNTKAPEGIVIGQLPEVTGDCCGSITVAIRYPNDLGDDPCFTPFNVDYQVKLTWPCDWHPQLQALAISHFRHYLATAICCKWPDTDNKNTKKPDVNIAGVDDDLTDECPSIVFNIEIR